MITAMLSLQPVNPFARLKARNVLIWFFVSLILSVICCEVIASFIGLNSEDPIVSEILFSIVHFLMYGSTCLWILQRYRQLQINPQDVVGKLPSGYKWLSIAGLVIILDLLFCIGFLFVLFGLLSLFAPEFLESLFNSTAEPLASSSPIYYNLVMIFSAVVFAPITEEFIFRGFLLHRWGTKWGITPAILVSSMIFGLCHPGVSVATASIGGIVYSLLYLRSRTLIIPIVAHALNNAIVTGLMLFPDSASTVSTVSESSSAFDALMLGLFGLFCIALSAPFIIHFIYKKWPNQRMSLPYWLNRKSRKSNGCGAISFE